jgi:hypothetical protein
MSTMTFLPSNLGFIPDADPKMMPFNSVHLPRAYLPVFAIQQVPRTDLGTEMRAHSQENNTSQSYQDELLLPDDFEPSPYSVVCGRGRRSTAAIGNRRLNVIASMYVQKYSNAAKKEEKSMIVTEILDIIKSACPQSRHAFVRHSNGQWWRVQNLQAREKIGTVLRDCLHSKYKSSTKSKLAKRKRKKSLLPEKSVSNSLLSGSICDGLNGEEMDNLFE